MHIWTQIVGKIRMEHMPLSNHWWQVTLYVTTRGLVTGGDPYRDALFDMEFDFANHVLAVPHSAGSERTVPLETNPVAQFYGETLWALDSLGIESQIDARPNEVDPAIPFAEDYQHSWYDPPLRACSGSNLVQADRVIGNFRASFVGKVSPVQFFWALSIWRAPDSRGTQRRRIPAGRPIARTG